MAYGARRTIRRMPVYRYPQELFYKVEPDVLVQATSDEPLFEDIELTNYAPFGSPGYGSPAGTKYDGVTDWLDFALTAGTSIWSTKMQGDAAYYEALAAQQAAQAEAQRKAAMTAYIPYFIAGGIVVSGLFVWGLRGIARGKKR